MQLKEIINFITKQLFKFNYFHGFVTQELRHQDRVKDTLLEFYQTFTKVLEDVVQKGIVSGVLKSCKIRRYSFYHHWNHRIYH